MAINTTASTVAAVSVPIGNSIVNTASPPSEMIDSNSELKIEIRCMNKSLGMEAFFGGQTSLSDA